MKNYIRQFILVFVMSVGFQFLFAQSPVEVWTRFYNGPANGSDAGREVAIDANNNIYIAGGSSSKGGNRDYAVVKYNSSGQQLWVARYDGPAKDDDYIHGLEVDATGNVYVTGMSIGIGSLYDYATVKFNSSGIQQWVARFNGPGNVHDVAKDLKVDPSGNVYVTGLSDGSYSNAGNVIRTIKYNSFGERQWVAEYDGLPTGNGNSEDANSLALDPSGNVYIAAASGGMKTIKYNNSGIEQWVRSSGDGNGRSIVFDGSNIVVTGWGSRTVKYTPAGEVVWDATYVGPSSALAAFQDIAIDGSGNVFVTGYCSGSGTKDDYTTVMYNANGVQQWAKRYNGSFNGIDLARAIAIDDLSNVYVTGYGTVVDGSKNGGVRMVTVKYSISGTEQWVAIAPTQGQGFGVAVSGGSIYAAGEGAPKMISDFMTVRYTDVIPGRATSTNLTNSNSKYAIRNFPNPFKLNTTIAYELAKEGQVVIRVFDLAGHEVAELVNEKKTAGQHQVQFNAGRLASGTYLCKIQSGDYTETRRMIIEK